MDLQELDLVSASALGQFSGFHDDRYASGGTTTLSQSRAAVAAAPRPLEVIELPSDLAQLGTTWAHRLVGFVLLVLASPVMLVAALAVVLSSRGPAFYRQRRFGLGGEEFGCWKFRTMVVDADARLQALLENDPVAKAEWLASAKLENDPRITSVGRFLRVTSLDELPQLFNVIKGHMGLVGPRPLAHEHELNYYGHHRRTLFSVRPGMTGLWQVSGRSTLTMPERVVFDLDYIERRGVALDIQILLRTVGLLLMPWRSGAR